jgi:rhodanese-related sulfurtransferase
MINQVTPHDAHALIARGEVEVVDVREAGEWATGHIAGARHVPLARFRAAPEGTLPHDGVLFVCAAGIRSETAARIAVANGVTRVYNLRGGTQAWVKAGLPLAHDELSVAV